MGKFYEQSPLSVKLGKEFDKVPERGPELSDKVDKIVSEIQSSKDEKEKQKKMEQLLVHIHPLLEREVSVFYRRYQEMLLKRGLEKEDVNSFAVQEMMRCAGKWEDQETRKSKGKTAAHFITFLFSPIVLPSRLKVHFIDPIFTEMRKGHEVSISQPIPKSGYSGGRQWPSRTWQDILLDENSENALTKILEKEGTAIAKETILNKLYLDSDPFLSLMVILKFGLAKDVLDKWKEKFDRSVKEGKLNRFADKYVSKVGHIIAGYTGNEMRHEDVAELFGNARQNIQKKLDQALKILKAE